MQLQLWGGATSHVVQVPVNATAYYHRDILWVIQVHACLYALNAQPSHREPCGRHMRPVSIMKRPTRERGLRLPRWLCIFYHGERAGNIQLRVRPQMHGDMFET